jgi:DNA-binding winged helix-turn-helix (wHTH) protein/tetratricopeptide (TPR) repeat protein
VFPPFWLDLKNEQLWCKDRLIALRPKPFAVLRYLLERPRQLVKKEELLSQLWGDANVGEAVLKKCLSDIRHALGDPARSPCFIQTAHRRGYRFIGPIETSVIGATPEAPRLEPTEPPGALPDFVGRRAELRLLDSALERAIGGERQVVFITGEPGVGKTMLVKAFVERARQTGPLVIAHGQCIGQYGTGEPYMPVLEALQRLCRGARGEEFIEVLRREAPTWLAQLPGVTVERHQAEHGLAAPERMLREISGALETFSEQSPCVLVFEDLHWADYSTLDLVSYIAQRYGPASLLVIGTYRRREMLSSPNHRESILYSLRERARCRELLLSNLDQRAITEYLSQRFPGHRLPSELAEILHDRTNGNPLFLCHVVNGWLESGCLRQEQGTVVLGTPLGSLSREVPESVLRMIEAEFEGLTAIEQRLLRAASVAGPEFSTASVAFAIDEDILRVEELCTDWARRGRFFERLASSEWPDGTLQHAFTFTHALYHQVFYELTGATQRAHFHRRIGQRREAGQAQLAPQIAAELAMHFELGREPLRAVHYLRLAGEQAMRRSACREAVDHLERALAVLERLPGGPSRNSLELELQVQLGPALSTAKGYAAPEVEKTYARARELCRLLEGTPNILPVLAGTAAFYLVRGDHRTARELCEQLLHQAQQASDRPALTEAHTLVGMISLYEGKLMDARAHLEQAIAQHEPEQPGASLLAYQHDPGVIALTTLSWVSWTLGYPDRALTESHRASAMAERLKHPYSLAFATYATAATHLFRCEWTACREAAASAIELAAEHGFPFVSALAQMADGAALVELGQVTRGLDLLREGWKQYEGGGAEVAGPFFGSLLGRAYIAERRFEDALRALAAALGIVRRNGEVWWESELYRQLGELLLLVECPEQFMRGAIVSLPNTPAACFEKALESCRQQGAKSLELRAACSLARLREGHPDEPALSRLRALLEQLSEGEGTLDQQEARRLVLPGSFRAEKFG